MEKACYLCAVQRLLPPCRVQFHHGSVLPGVPILRIQCQSSGYEGHPETEILETTNGVPGNSGSRNVSRRAFAVPRKLRRRRILRRGKNSGDDDLYIIVLLNDPSIDRAYVQQFLPIAVPTVTSERAELCWLESRLFGQGVVMTATQEVAEMYKDRMIGLGLKAMIKRDDKQI